MNDQEYIKLYKFYNVYIGVNMSFNVEKKKIIKDEVIQDIKNINLKGTVELSKQNIYNDFQEFMFSNKIMIGAASFAIGVATKDVIEQVMISIILPLFKIPFSYIQKSLLKSSFILKILQKRWIQLFINAIGNVSWAVLLWLTVIFFAFFLLEYILNRKVIGITSKVSIADKKDFVKAKKDAKSVHIVPTDKEDIKNAKLRLIEDRVDEISFNSDFDKYKF